MALDTEADETNNVGDAVNFSARIYPVATINPKTGLATDLVATLFEATSLVFAQAKTETFVLGQVKVCLALQNLLEANGFSVSMSHFILLLNELSLVRKLGKDGSRNCYAYQVMNPAFFEQRITVEVVEAALRSLKYRKQQHDTVAALKRQVAELSAASAKALTTVDVSVPTDREVELLAQLELANEQAERLEAQIASLNADLAEKASALSLDERMKVAKARLLKLAK